MRVSIYLITLIMTFGCNGQRAKTKKMDTRKNDKEIMEQGSQLKERDSIMMKNGKLDIRTLMDKGISSSSNTPTDEGWKRSTAYNYEENLPGGTYVYISGNEVSGYSKTVRVQKADFETYYEYYPSGETKQTGELYANQFTKGIWCWFSEKGEIEKYEDYDAPFDFSWEDVLSFLKQKEIKKSDINQITRGIENRKPIWYISFKTKELENTDNVQQYIINGTTGEVIKKELLDISRELD